MALQGVKIARFQHFDSVFGHFGHLSPVVTRGYRWLNVEMVKTNCVLLYSIEKHPLGGARWRCGGVKIAQIQRFDSVFGHFGHLSPVVARGYR